MVASGCTAEQIASAVKAACAIEEKVKAEKREKDKLRQRAKREREKGALKIEASEMSRDVTSCHADTEGQGVTQRDTVSLSPVPLLSPTPPNNPLTPKPIQKINSRAHRLPDDWQLSDADRAYGVAKGLNASEIAGLGERFSSWAWSAGGQNARKVDWHKAWQGWVQRDGPKLIQARAGPRPTTFAQQRRVEHQGILNDLDNIGGTGGYGSQENPEFLSGNSGERSEAIRGGSGSNLIEISPGGYRQSG